MGTKSSKTGEENINEKEIKLQPQFFGTNYDESFSTSQNTQNEEKTTGNTNNEISTKKYPFKFEYKGNGKSVLLAGSFLDNWNNIKVMIKNKDTNNFERVVYLPKGKHQFKFIVDNKWLCSNQYPTIPDDQGNINNFIDLTNYSPPEEILKEELRKKLGEKKQEKNNKEINNSIISNNSNKEYTTIKPERNELNMNAPGIIRHYLPTFNLDYQSNQNKFRTKKYLKFKERNIHTENNTYKKILVCPHEKLMHLCPNIEDLVLKRNNKGDNNYIKICTTTRNKHKFLTTVYYTPWKIL